MRVLRSVYTEVGYGKTACMIALINQTVTNGLKAHALLPEEMKMFRNRFFTNATLIVTPRFALSSTSLIARTQTTDELFSKDNSKVDSKCTI